MDLSANYKVTLVDLRFSIWKCFTKDEGMRLIDAPKSRRALSKHWSPIIQEINGDPGSFFFKGSILKIIELTCLESTIVLPFFGLHLGVHSSLRNLV
jgi:hypothetical protein